MNSVIAKPVKASRRAGIFERYLSLWVALCMAAGVVLGKLLPAAVQGLRGLEFGTGARSTCRSRC